MNTGSVKRAFPSILNKMRIIYKYPLKCHAKQIITTNPNAKILCVQIQNDVPCLWIEVDAENDGFHSFTIETFGTGHEMSETKREYIGTYQMFEGAEIYHVYKSS